MPGPHGSSLHLGFATGGAAVLRVRAYLRFLHHFPAEAAAQIPQTRSEPGEQLVCSLKPLSL